VANKYVLTLVAVVLSFVIATTALPKSSDSVGVAVHEWGTFTSVAGEKGSAVPWRTFGGPSDLPCFVETFGGFKGGMYAYVRMETPVLYFYGAHDFTANVNVRFPNGTITEWFPKADLTRSYDAIEWQNVRVSPNAALKLPAGGQSHYFAARETDAAPLQVGSQNEKFLFYRGVGNFSVPISVKAEANGTVVVKNRGEAPIPSVVLFENHQGHRRYQLAGAVQSELTLTTESWREDSSRLFTDIEQILTEQGLYPREARAMIETWRDSWFEEGTRVFYIVPTRTIDSVLPLEIQPAPQLISRVFVGRMEIITPAIQEEVGQAIASNDAATLEKYGRFLEAISQRMGVKSPLLNSVYSKYVNSHATCRQ
jgi:hypothetical protein